MRNWKLRAHERYVSLRKLIRTLVLQPVSRAWTAADSAFRCQALEPAEATPTAVQVSTGSSDKLEVYCLGKQRFPLISKTGLRNNHSSLSKLPRVVLDKYPLCGFLWKLAGGFTTCTISVESAESEATEQIGKSELFPASLCLLR